MTYSQNKLFVGVRVPELYRRFKIICLQVYSGEVARLRSYVTQRPPFDVKNPYMSPIAVNNNIHKVNMG